MYYAIDIKYLSLIIHTYINNDHPVMYGKGEKLGAGGLGWQPGPANGLRAGPAGWHSARAGGAGADMVWRAGLTGPLDGPAGLAVAPGGRPGLVGLACCVAQQILRAALAG